ncbi:hypothetical protein M2651_13255 [Clostridium sp. SYSU_GA19001]|uniref:CsxC family protein n=1 Tax=Clostridium caldaquaticum TaxID=2940653 RepID=UPI0020775957|nr:hypothetical protein [Clostridium caldaquaticum]MCM8711967.1 hypothetical protein [Clostridium caldaquaticum]
MSQENIMNDYNEIAQKRGSSESEAVDSVTLNECKNKCNSQVGCTGPLVAKIPVVLADVEIQVDVESKIKLKEPVLDLKTIDKHIHLTECKLIPHTDKLFISGYVQKNIQFSAIDCTNTTSISGNIQHTTVKLPFKCVTKIKFAKHPIYGRDYKKKINVLDKDMLGKDQKEESWIHFSKLCEPVFCELEYVKILETDILSEKCSLPNTLPNEKPLQELTEKMVIYIRLKVLQNQHIFIPEPSGDVTLLDNDYSRDAYYKEKKQPDIQVEYDPDKGMVGKEASSYNFHDD